MKRRTAREYALQGLFRLEFTGEAPDGKLITQICEDNDPEILSFTNDLVRGTYGNMSIIDMELKSAAQNWAIERMATVDRIILRIATYELLFRADIPAPVTINEALEIAKKYSTLESASFINGILDRIAREKRLTT